MARPKRNQVVRHSLSWFWLFALATALAGLAGLLWRSLEQGLGWPLAIATVGFALLLLSVAVAITFGAVRLPGRRVWLEVESRIRMLPFWVRELSRLGHPGSGRRNQRYASLEAFEGANPLRSSRDYDQLDFGKHWRDRSGTSLFRITWIEATGELIAVTTRPDGGPVEVLAQISSESEVEARLENWAHARWGGARLDWVRRRAYGWPIPLPARGQVSLEEDSQPPLPWPTPPLPSLGQDVGAYIGTISDHEERVELVTPDSRRPLYQYVEHSPTGFAWGYLGAGPTDLARSILADRLGYIPQRSIAFEFRDDVIARFDHEEPFILEFSDVDAWIDDHVSLFAANPRAQPFDPYAAGGAYPDE